MAQIVVGKLLPNLKVTLGNDAEETMDSDESDSQSTEDLKKDSENSKVEIVRSWMESLQNPKIYKNKSGGFTTGLDLISEDNTEILEKRAERFGLEDEAPVLPQNITSLYESMGVCLENRNSAKMKNMRLEALHMRGVNELNTSEIFNYFRDYGPASVEWINDFSCNVVWLDEVSCARALLGVSKPIDSSTKTKPIKETSHDDSDNEAKDEESSSSSEKEKVENEKQEDTMDVDGETSEKSSESLSLEIPVPPGHWRLGTAHAKAKTILLRFATKDDKKLPGAEKRSNYYKKYGNPNYGGLKGLISASRKRKLQAAASRQAIKTGSSTNKSILRASSPDSDRESDDNIPKTSKQKPPRMRMYADDEELKTKKWSSNSIQIQSEKPKNVHSRLGLKYTRDDLCRLGSYHRGPERDRRSPDLNNYEIETTDSISEDSKWSRKRNWNSGPEQVDLRTKLRRLRNNAVNELRDESGKKHRSPLCLDTDNLSDD